MKKFTLVFILFLFTGILMTSCGSQPPANNEINDLSDTDSTSSIDNKENASENDILSSGQGLWSEFAKEGTTFLGSSVCSLEEFTLEYEIFDTTLSWPLALSEGNSLSVNLVVETGSLAVLIEDEDGNVFYQDDSAETEAFDLEITESGVYKITVVGSHTQGKASFKRT